MKLQTGKVKCVCHGVMRFSTSRQRSFVHRIIPVTKERCCLIVILPSRTSMKCLMMPKQNDLEIFAFVTRLATKTVNLVTATDLQMTFRWDERLLPVRPYS